MKYTFNSRVRYSEIDPHSHLSLTGIVKYYQDCAIFQSEEVGVGLDFLQNRNRAWILSYWQIVVDRYPKLGEEIQIGTFAHDFKGMLGQRNFFIRDASNEMISHANSVWFFMDTKNGRPVKPEQRDIDAYEQEPAMEMAYEDRKIAVPENGRTLDPFPIPKCYIDTNEHVNNAAYVEMAEDILHGERQVYQLRVDYKKSAMLGDMVYPILSEEKDRTVVTLGTQTGEEYAIIEFKWQ